MALRDTARQNIIDSVTEAAQKDHERNYQKLHVHRDGTVLWFESINRSDDIIDGQVEGFRAVPSVVTVGRGGYACNCDYCNDEEYETKAEAIADCVGDSDLSDMEQAMLRSLEEIPIGYFDDETVAEVSA